MTTKGIQAFGICALYVILSVFIYAIGYGAFAPLLYSTRMGSVSINNSLLTFLSDANSYKELIDDIHHKNYNKRIWTNVSEEHPQFHKISYSKIYIYSAFFEPLRKDLETPLVIALGIKARSERKVLLRCRITYSDSSQENVEADSRFAQDNHPENSNHTVFFAECPSNIDKHPISVSFARYPDYSEEFEHTVIHPGKEIIRNMTVCHGVVFGNYNSDYSVLQNVEYNRIMGAEHFFLYNQSMGPKLIRLLNFYHNQGLVTIPPIPKFPPNFAHYHGQAITINDCMLRNRNVSRYVAVMDTDEYILPLHHRSWIDVINNVTESERDKKPGLIGAFSFKHSMYCGVHMSDKELKDMQLNSNISGEAREFAKKYNVDVIIENHRAGLMGYPRRSKTIYRPELVREPGIHYARVMWQEGRVAVVDEKIGFLAHHRHMGKNSCSLNDTKVFPAAKEYLENLKMAYIEYENYIGKTIT